MEQPLERVFREEVTVLHEFGYPYFGLRRVLVWHTLFILETKVSEFYKTCICIVATTNSFVKSDP